DAWCDHVLVYSRARFVFTCPLLPDASGGYAFNEALRGRSLGDVGDPATTPLLFDGPRGWNVYAGPGDVRAAHGGGWQVVYVDSYVRWRSSEDVDALQWNPQSE
ncbi:MAG TPA: hypothetical protein QGH10_00550, partial [Armatimonadota bacterium]|nr:hypothetical protein [Armatimonadota bacterium]